MNILITGGAGFIGVNLAYHFAKSHRVTVYDSLEREGSRNNLAWLKSIYPSTIFVKGDITDQVLLSKIVKRADIILHLAAQVGVTTSLKDPKRDFLVNTVGTLSLLEEVRRAHRVRLFAYSSTNKVYGNLKELQVKRTSIDEYQPISFDTPYGSSKGAAETYVMGYGKWYGMPTVVLRQSCVYGPRQWGTEDQGWVAHFARQAVVGKPITVFGDGSQVRDILYVDDLVALFDRLVSVGKHFTGDIFNIGGGSDNAISLSEAIVEFERVLKRPIRVKYEPARAHDQQWYISNIGKARIVLGWRPTVPIGKGMVKLVEWVGCSVFNKQRSKPIR